MADKLLEIKDLEVLYKSGKNPVHAVNGISLTLNKGETLGLVGETGAGKTTTALAILRLLPDRTGCINQGQILFEGRDLILCLFQGIFPGKMPVRRSFFHRIGTVSSLYNRFLSEIKCCHSFDAARMFLIPGIEILSALSNSFA